MSDAIPHQVPAWRRFLVLGMLGVAFGSLVWRAFDLQVFNGDFLRDQGNARHLRVVDIPAHRGMIVDRNGTPLAASTPVDSVWANPQELASARTHLPALARVLGLEPDAMQRTLASRAGREFVYLKRHVGPAVAAQVRELDAPGVYLQREYRRYYPDGEVAGHVLGFTDIDDVGQEGLELAFDDWLRGEAGAKRVVKDGRRSVVEDVESIREPRPGRDLVLSLDRRIQYLAYRELKAAVLAHKARSGSVVILDARNGEVLAMVNQPSFNPNNRRALKVGAIRNRAVTDVFEPGSTFKPFTVAAALELGMVQPDTPIDTTPGEFQVGVNTVRDVRNYGRLDVTGVIRKSSNVGVSKIALALPKQPFWTLLKRAGFGSVSATGFPGEASGLLLDFERWREIEMATLAFGYGISVTPLQLAQSYMAFANDGSVPPVTFLHMGQERHFDQVLTPATARQVRAMLEQVVGPGGTAQLANVAGYRVAGKTGTVRKSIAGGYAEDRYLSVFAGLAPASDPRLVAVVMINEPSAGDYYGGKVAAPLFSRVMAGALRLLNVAPDNLPDEGAVPLRQAAIGGAA